MRATLDDQLKSFAIAESILRTPGSKLSAPAGTKLMQGDILLFEQLKRIRTHVNKAGWVETEGKYTKAWRKRWFALRGTSLIYFENLEKMVTSSSKPRGEVKLTTETTVSEKYHLISSDTINLTCFTLRGSKNSPMHN
jgi:hypothetical protein